MALDERIERELDRVARPADPSGVYEGLIRRRERLRMRRRVSAGAIAFAVFIGGALGVYALSRTLGNEPRPAAAPMGGRIVLSTGTEADGSASPQGWHLVSMNPDGSDRVDISPAGIISAEFPTVSPDGGRIAFAGFERRRHGLYVMQTDGSDVERILTLERDVDFIKALAWSPDGERIAILREVGSQVGEVPTSGATEFDWATTIWIVAPDGSDLQQVTTSGRETGVSWSPDSSRLAFSRHAPVDPGARTVASDVFTIDADGSNEVRLTTDGSSSSPAWSPDGATIAFDHSPPTGEAHDLYLMDADGSNPRPLTSAEGNEYGAAWSPTGDALVFSELKADATREHSLAQVSVIRPDGSGYRVLTSSEIGPPATGLWWSVTPGSLTETPTGETQSRRSPTQVGPVALCETTSVAGTFGSSASDAVVGMLPRSDGTCGRPTGEEAVEGVAVIDLTGDGSHMIASEPFPCEGGCNAYAAPDVDGDGSDELLVQDVQFSVAGLLLLDVVEGDSNPVLRPAMVAPPGDAAMAQQGFDGSTTPRFWIGGDGFGSDALRCEPSADGRLLVSSSAQMDPPDSPDAVWKVHETTFRLESGALTVVNVRDYEEPTGPDAPASFRDTGGCGADLEPYA